MIGPGIPNFLLPGKAIHEFTSKIFSKNYDPIKFGDLSSYRDYLDIRDACEIILKVASENFESGPFNVASGIAIQGKDLIDRIINLCPIKSIELDYLYNNLSKSAVPYQKADISKIISHYAWHPKYSLDDSISDMWKFHLENLESNET